MILTFRCRDTQRVFNDENPKRFKLIARAARRKLLLLHAAVTLQSLAALLGNRFEKLRGDRLGQYSIRVNQQWRICFTWHENNAYDVEIVDYH